jgi:hypothetical protein
MQTLTSSVTCPTCGFPATITLSEDIDPVSGTECHAIRLHCANPLRHRQATEVEKLRVWALNHALRQGA